MNYSVFQVQNDYRRSLKDISDEIADEFWILYEYMPVRNCCLFENTITFTNKTQLATLILEDLLFEKRRALSRSRITQVIISPEFSESISSTIVIRADTQIGSVRFSSTLGGDGVSSKRRLVIDLENCSSFLSFEKLKRLIKTYFGRSNRSGFIVVTTESIFDKYFSPSNLIYGWMGIYSKNLTPTKLPASVVSEDVNGEASFIVTTKEMFDDSNNEHLMVVEQLSKSFDKKFI